MIQNISCFQTLTKGLRTTIVEMNYKASYKVISPKLTLFLGNVDLYAGFLMGVGVLGMISFALSFSICYMRKNSKKGYSPEQHLFNF